MRNLRTAIPDAPNFYYYEFVKSETATRLNIPNTPIEHHWVAIEKLAKYVLQPVRNEFGPIRITSGYRSPELCVKIGSSIHSNHAKGQAADFEPYSKDIKMIDIISFIYDKLPYRELIAEYFPDGWIHCAYREDGNNKTLKLKDKNYNFEVVSIDMLKKLYN